MQGRPGAPVPFMPATTPSLRTRLAFAALSLLLFWTSATWFLRLGNSSTDENLFTPPPAPAYLSTPLECVTGTIPAGAFIVTVEARRVTTAADVTAGLATRGAEDRIAFVYVPDDRATDRIHAETTARALRAATLVDAAQTALVIEVTAGGASDRAGMKVGDLITKIGGRGFQNVNDADRLMRGGGAGRTYSYDVLRDGQPVTLNITLARFGVGIPPLVLFAAGYLLMLFGAWLLWVRPNFIGARLLGLGFLLLGFGVSTVLTRRTGGGPANTLLDLILSPFTVLAAVAVFTHAAAYFPREWPTLSTGWGYRGLVYGVTIAAIVTLAVFPNNLVFAGGVIAVMAASAAAKWWHRRSRPADYRRMNRALVAAGNTAAIGALMMVLLPGVLGKQAVNLPFIVAAGVLATLPLAYLYTIGQYRIFDLRLRVRRDVQYSLVSFAWAVVPFAVLLCLLWTLPQVHLPLPAIRMTGTSVELMDETARMPGGDALEKGVLMVVAIGLAFALRDVAQRGQRFLATKFHRGRYDYRRATQLIGEVTSTRLNLEGLCEGVVSTLAGVMPVKRAGILLCHGGRTHCPTSAHGFTDEEWQAFCRASAGDLLASMKDVRSEVSAAYAPPRIGDALRASDLEYAYPLRAKDSLVGALLVGEKQSEAAFQNDDFEFLAAIGAQVAASVENAFLYEDLAVQERMKHELQIARQIQMESLPQFTPRVDGLDVAGVSIPALEVGGDYFDYLNGRPERLTVMVGDVSGKGTSAALYMSKLQGILRSLHGFDLSPRELFVRTNQLLCRDLERRSFVTAIGGFFDTEHRKMVLARAGHLPLYHYRADRREVVSALPRGLGFGLSTRAIFADQLEELTIAYRPGDVFLFVTDGITDCQNAEGDLFGEERLLEAFVDEASRQPTAVGLRDALTARVRQFAAGNDPFDDITVVVVRAV